MAVPHANPGEVIDVRPLLDKLTSATTKTLIKTTHIEVIRLVLPKGKVLSEHKAPGEITVQCLEGRISFSSQGASKELQAGDLLYLLAAQPHRVEALEDSSFLLTIALPTKATSA